MLAVVTAHAQTSWNQREDLSPYILVEGEYEYLGTAGRDIRASDPDTIIAAAQAYVTANFNAAYGGCLKLNWRPTVYRLYNGGGSVRSAGKAASSSSTGGDCLLGGSDPAALIHAQVIIKSCPVGFRRLQYDDMDFHPRFSYALCGKIPEERAQCETEVGNPITCGSGLKRQVESDIPPSGPLSLSLGRSYVGGPAQLIASPGWSFDYVSWRLTRLGGAGNTHGGCMTAAGPDGAQKCHAYVWPGEGLRYLIRSSADDAQLLSAAAGQSSVRSVRTGDRVIVLPSSDSLFVLRNESHLDEFLPSGEFKARWWPDGKYLITTYSDTSTTSDLAPGAGYLIAVADPFGRAIQFRHDSAGRVSSVIDPAGAIYRYRHDPNGSLEAIVYPNGAQKTYLYDEPSLRGGAAESGLLTGIVDENGARYATFGYDASGRAVSTEHAGGVERFQVDHRYTEATVAGPLGETIEVRLTGGSGLLASSKTTTCEGCNSAPSRIERDGRTGMKVSETVGEVKTCVASEAGRPFERLRVEGLHRATVCSTVTADGASLPAGSRKISTRWHPDWRLEAARAEPDRITHSIYNGQPDPFNGNAVASCAPDSARLPDGKPVVVLCRQVEQATLDATGTLGFSAAPAPGVPLRVQAWTYNAYGQVLTHDGPRTDVNDISVYTYHAATTADATRGDLASVTGPTGKTTRYTRYNRHGKVLESIDPNGVVTTHAYDARLRLLSTAVAGSTTRYSYDAVGQLTRITRPGGAFVGFTYDAAHRMTATFDSLGNRIDYTLDNAGNRVAESVKDPTGSLARQVGRVFDALGRVRVVSGLEGS